MNVVILVLFLFISMKTNVNIRKKNTSCVGSKNEKNTWILIVLFSIIMRKKIASFGISINSLSK